MAERRVLYFAHPVNVFDTPLEVEMEHLILATFPEARIENPNQKHHQEGYARWKERTDASGHKGMGYYYEEVLSFCDGCVALPFLDGKWGAGVVGEAQFFLKKGQPVYRVIVPQVNKIRELSAFLRLQLLENNLRIVLSVEETRARTWVSSELYNKEKLPYDRAHLVRFVHEQWTSEYLKSVSSVPKT